MLFTAILDELFLWHFFHLVNRMILGSSLRRWRESVGVLNRPIIESLNIYSYCIDSMRKDPSSDVNDKHESKCFYCER